MADSRLLEYNQLLCAFSSLPTTDVELDNGEMVQNIIKHQFQGICGRDSCHFCSVTWNMAMNVLKYGTETKY